MDVSCKKSICNFNKCLHCSANNIVVSADVNCKTYQKNKKKLPINAQDASQNLMMEVGNIEKNYKENENVGIKCKARSCMFNREGNCTANGISVLSSRKSAFCATYVKK
jgi:hypothetical protein